MTKHMQRRNINNILLMGAVLYIYSSLGCIQFVTVL